MTTQELVDYAKSEISRLRLSHGGDLGTEFVCAYTDAGEGAVRLSDGQGLNVVCRTTGHITAELEQMRAWCDEK